jgi:hypothetical protein
MVGSFGIGIDIEFDPLVEFRDLKLKIVTEDFKFSIKENMLDKMHDQLDLIKSEFSNDVITGSLALNLYELVYRDINDIDILIKDDGRYVEYYNSNYSNDNDVSNNLGWKMVSYKRNIFSRSRDFKVDFFKNSGVKYNTFMYKGVLLKIHDPLEIINEKIKMCELVGTTAKFSSRRKHKKDLIEIFKRINWE